MTASWNATLPATERNLLQEMPKGEDSAKRHLEPVGRWVEIPETRTFPLTGYFLG